MLCSFVRGGDEVDESPQNNTPPRWYVSITFYDSKATVRMHYDRLACRLRDLT
jgi:hypothetical protein